MSELSTGRQLKMYPRRMTLAVLCLVFAIESGIMLLIPSDLVRQFGPWGVAILDSIILTFLLVPCLWSILVVPLTRIAQTRSRLLNWAMMSEERKVGQLARDLHDGVGQLVASLKLGLVSLSSSSSDSAFCEQLDHMRGICDQLNDSIRDLARGLRPRELDDLGLQAAIEKLVRQIRLQAAVDISVEVRGLESFRPAEVVETAVYRIAQEAVTNAIRHGDPSRIDIDIVAQEDMLQLIVADDGRGFDYTALVSPSSGREQPFGLFSMRERAENLGGSADFVSFPGRGTRIEISIPLPARTTSND